MQTVENKALAQIARHGRGWVFTPQDLANTGSPHAVLMALLRLSRQGRIRRLARGVYDYPEVDARLGPISPSPEAVARAVAGRDAARLQPTGAYAANLLGLSDQVPMRVVFLTDGKGRTVRIGKLDVILKHATLRTMATAGRTSGRVIQALRYLGQRHVDDAAIRRLRDVLSPADKARLLRDLRYAPAWVAAFMRQIAREEA